MKLLRLMLVLSLVLFGACQKQNPKPTGPQVEYYTHTVQNPGETLAAISKWRTGTANNWEAILDHNAGLDVRRIRVGTSIMIPRTWVINSKPMPRPSVTAKSAPAAEADMPAVAENAVDTPQEQVAAESAPVDAPPAEAMPQEEVAAADQTQQGIASGDPQAGFDAVGDPSFGGEPVAQDPPADGENKSLVGSILRRIARPTAVPAN